MARVSKRMLGLDGVLVLLLICAGCTNTEAKPKHHRPYGTADSPYSHVLAMLSELPRRPDKVEQVFELGRKHVASDFVVDAWLTGLREVGPAEGAEAAQISFIAFMMDQGVQIGEHLASFAFIVDGDTRTTLFWWLRMQSRDRQEPAETVWDSARARCTYVHGDWPEQLIVHVAAE